MVVCWSIAKRATPLWESSSIAALAKISRAGSTPPVVSCGTTNARSGRRIANAVEFRRRIVARAASCCLSRSVLTNRWTQNASFPWVTIDWGVSG